LVFRVFLFGFQGFGVAFSGVWGLVVRLIPSEFRGCFQGLLLSGACFLRGFWLSF